MTASAASTVTEATKTAAKANAEAKKLIKKNKSADVTMITLGLNRNAAKYVLDALNAFDPDNEHKLHVALATEINDQLQEA